MLLTTLSVKSVVKEEVLESPTTMRDVAEHAQVSLKTVSRVINGEPGVASETAARVMQSIADLGFRRNDLARSLRQGSTSATLGLVIEDVANPFYSAVVQAVESAARERGFLLITGSCEEDPRRERELIEALMGRRVDALLLVPAGRERDHQWIEREVLQTTPVVFLDRPPRGIEADTVLVDNARGAAWPWSTCSPPATGGSPTSATCRTSTPRASGSPGSGRRWRPRASSPTHD